VAPVPSLRRSMVAWPNRFQNPSAGRSKKSAAELYVRSARACADSSVKPANPKE
jgi:hypothetical protein